MNLYVIRHAHALDAAEDPERPLSRRGRQQVRAVTAWLRAGGAVDTRDVWHSPLARSVETAELFVEELGLKARLVEIAGLEGDADPRIAADRLAKRRQPLAIVGHEPHLSALLSLLIAGIASPPRFVLKKCAVVALEKQEHTWAVRWHVSPELIAGARSR